MAKYGEVVIEGDLIVFRIQVLALPGIVELGPDGDKFKIVDAPAFAKDLVRHMNDEPETGPTPMQELFDRMIYDAFDNGADGVEDLPDPDAERDCSCDALDSANCSFAACACACHDSGRAPGMGKL